MFVYPVLTKALNLNVETSHTTFNCIKMGKMWRWPYFKCPGTLQYFCINWLCLLLNRSFQVTYKWFCFQ